MEINIEVLLIGITIFSNLFLGFLTLLSSRRNPTNIFFFLLTFVLNIWIVINYLSYQYLNPDKAFLLAKLVLFFAILIGYFFYLFIDTFIKNRFSFRSTTIALTALAIINLFLTLNSKFFSGMLIINDSFKPVVEPWIISFSILPVGVILYSILKLARKTIQSESLDRNRLIDVLVGSGIMFLFIILFDFVLPSFFSNTIFIPMGTLFTIPFTAFTAFAIIKYKLFNIKVIATELIIFSLWIFLLIRTLTSSSPEDQIIDGGLLITTIIIGVLLIRSVMKEVKQREKLEILTGELEDANDNLENLIKQRESLVHLITHKVKGSFTRTKVLFASMLDGTFGEISPEIKKRAAQGLEFDNGGIQTVDLVLNVANMQNGLIKYDLKNLDFKELVEQSISEKRIPAEAKGLKLEIELEDGVYNVLGDSIWLKEAVNNLIDNSIHYTKEGKIVVELKKKDNHILLSIKDTGIGITDEDKQNLFKEGGRGKDSVKVNVDSTGYGLFTVKLIVEAHKGRAWVESEGENKGSQFFVELPVI
ncbi:MAG: ATP-binding protein [Candidatus Paceibacterota bacterium]